MNTETPLLTRIGMVMAMAMCMLSIQPVMAAGLLTPTNSNLPALEIKDHEVTVTIEDGYAITQVEQVFHNPHAQDLEARYSFPVPEHGSVAEMTLWIDGKPVTGEVLEKEKERIRDSSRIDSLRLPPHGGTEYLSMIRPLQMHAGTW